MSHIRYKRKAIDRPRPECRRIRIEQQRDIWIYFSFKQRKNYVLSIYTATFTFGGSIVKGNRGMAIGVAGRAEDMNIVVRL